jgi:hypothetical protein
MPHLELRWKVIGHRLKACRILDSHTGSYEKLSVFWDIRPSSTDLHGITLLSPSAPTVSLRAAGNEVPEIGKFY